MKTLLKKVFLLIFILAVTVNITACCANKFRGSSDYILKERIAEYYRLLSEGNYEKCWLFWDTEARTNKDKFVSNFQKANLEITSFKITSLSIADTTAKVGMTLVVEEGNKEYTTNHFDYWKLTNENWFLTEFAVEGDEAVKEFITPEEFIVPNNN
jgi:hypothetical protein